MNLMQKLHRALANQIAILVGGRNEHVMVWQSLYEMYMHVGAMNDICLS